MKLENYYFVSTKFNNVQFKNCVFHNCYFVNAKFNKTSFKGCSFDKEINVMFYKTNLDNVKI